MASHPTDHRLPDVPDFPDRMVWVLGTAAVLFSVLYLLSDVIEAAQGGFSTVQLWLTLAAEAAIPLVVIGLWLVQRPAIGRLGAAGAVAYASTYVAFTGSVVYALVDGTPDYTALTSDLGVVMTLVGIVMVVAGLAFGAATLRAGVLPAWTGVALGVGVVLVGVTQSAPEGVQVVATAARDVAFAGTGVALLARPRGVRAASASTAAAAGGAELFARRDLS